MNRRSHIHKKADSSASNPVMSQLQSRPLIAQAQPQSSKPLSKTETETQEFQQHYSEATKLKLQAKYGTITPEGQERLTVLQAKMSSTLQRKLEQASSNGSNFADIPISAPDARLQQAVQTKLTIGEPGDKYEQEADRVAAQVVKQINAPVSPQRGQSQPVQREEVSEEEKDLQMKPMLQLRSAKVGMTAAPEVEALIKQARGGGQPLAKSIREPMEQAIGADFSRVKVHTDSRANQLNQSLQAKAFTTGQDVFFRQGEYNLGSRGGKELIAHELTHVVQQNTGSAVALKDANVTKGSQESTSVEQQPDKGDGSVQGTQPGVDIQLAPNSDRVQYGDWFSEKFLKDHVFHGDLQSAEKVAQRRAGQVPRSTLITNKGVETIISEIKNQVAQGNLQGIFTTEAQITYAECVYNNKGEPKRPKIREGRLQYGFRNNKVHHLDGMDVE